MDNLERLLVFGDIHGKWEKFQSAYRKVKFNPAKDLLVFLGDYLDRGEEPVPVMEWVMEHYGQKNMIFLRGNHEQMFYEALKERKEQIGLLDFLFGSPKGMWLRNGGSITYEEIKKTGREEALIDSWLKLIEQMPLYAEVVINDQPYWFMHANCNPALPLAKQALKDLLWERTLASHPEFHQGMQVIALGHTPVQALGYEGKPQWLQEGRLVLMDTGSFLEKGKISCADLLSRNIFQSDE